MKNIALNMALFVGIANLSAQNVELHLGCDCPTVRLDDAYCASIAVFEAMALGDDTVYTKGGIEPLAHDVIRSIPTSFLVSKVIKGTVAKNVIVHSATNVDDCGYHFRSGERYLIFATRENGMLVTDRCDATRPLSALTPGFHDSLAFVLAGNRWGGRTPVLLPCAE